MSQALDRNHEYMVLNYNLSPVAIATRDAQYLIQAGTRVDPVKFPMTLGEIIYVNSTSDAFKIGLLFFEPEFEEEIYKELRISDWKNILHVEDIDDAILHPTTEKLQRLIAIRSAMYYDRVYAEYVMLRNSGCAISSAVEQVIKARRSEIRRGVAATEIKVSTIEDHAQKQAETDAQVKALQEQVDELKRMLAAQASKADVPAEAPKQEPAKKPAPKTQTKTAQAKTTKGTKKQEG